MGLQARKAIRLSSTSSGFFRHQRMPGAVQCDDFDVRQFRDHVPGHFHRRHQVFLSENQERGAFHVLRGLQAGNVVVAGAEVGMQHPVAGTFHQAHCRAHHPHARHAVAADLRRIAVRIDVDHFVCKVIVRPGRIQQRFRDLDGHRRPDHGQFADALRMT